LQNFLSIVDLFTKHAAGGNFSLPHPVETCQYNFQSPTLTLSPEIPHLQNFQCSMISYNISGTAGLLKISILKFNEKSKHA